MRYGFLDESGDVTPFYGSNFLVVSVLTTANSRPIELHVKRAHKKLGRRPRLGEMKASTSEIAVIERLLQAIVQEEVKIITVVIDKRGIIRPPADPEDIYRLAVTKAVRHCVEQWPRITLYLDKRYTKKELRYHLEETIRQGLVGVLQEIVLIYQEDSRSHKGLQAADYVTWALFQKYEREDEHFYRLIADKVIVEEVVKHKLW